MVTPLQVCSAFVLVTLGIGVGVAIYQQLLSANPDELDTSSRTLPRSTDEDHEMLERFKNIQTNISTESSRTLPRQSDQSLKNSTGPTDVLENVNHLKAGDTSNSKSDRKLPNSTAPVKVHVKMNHLKDRETTFFSESPLKLPNSTVLVKVPEKMNHLKAGETNNSESDRKLPSSTGSIKVPEKMNHLKSRETSNSSESSHKLPNSTVPLKVLETMNILKAPTLKKSSDSAKVDEMLKILKAPTLKKSTDPSKVDEMNLLMVGKPTNSSESPRKLSSLVTPSKVPETVRSSCQEMIMSDLASVNNAIQTKYRLQCRESADVHSLQTALGSGYTTMLRLTETDHAEATEFINKLLNAIQDMGVPVNRAVISRISKKITNAQLNGVCVGATESFNSTKWANAFLPAKEYFFGLTNWYALLLDLNRKLAGYTFQRDTTNYNVYDVRNWGVGSQSQGIQVNGHNLYTFLQEVAYLKLAGIELINVSDVEDVIFRDLNRILNLNLKSQVQINENGGSLTIQGQFVVISKYKEILQDTKYSSVQIFALNTVFIDADIERTDKDFQLTIIAPTWDVQGGRRIVLDGASGESVSKAKGGNVDTPERAGDGVDGRPGNPGYPGGSFFGVGHVFRRGEALVVCSRGGEGGRGQDGGDGRDGQRQTETNHEATLKDMCPFRYPMPKQYEFISTARYFLYDGSFLKVFPVGVATDGGNGGSGGVGGVGGRPGDLSIVDLGGESGVRRETLPGSDGAGGLAGEGGKRGYIARTLIVYMKTGNCGLLCYSKSINQCDGFVDKELAGKELSGGLRGFDNSIVSGRQPPKPVRELPKSKVINMFKSYAWSNLKNVVMFSPLTMFLETLESSPVRSSYDTLNFVDELKYLDSANHPTDGKVDFTLYYRYILDALETYFKSSSKLNDEEVRVLGLVYTAALSRICRMRTRSDRSLITNLGLFLEQAKSNLPKLKDLKTYQEIDTIHANYKNNIDNKIKEANDFLTKHTLVEIDKVGAEIDRNIRTLERATKTLQKDARVNANALLEYERQLLGNKIFRAIFAGLRLASTFALVLIPTAKTIAPLLVVSGIFGVYTNGLLQIEQPNPQTYPEGLRDAIRELRINTENSSYERKLANFISLTERIVGEISVDYSQLNQFRDRVVEIRANVVGGATRSVASARDEMRGALHSAELDLQADDVRGREKLGMIRTLFYESDTTSRILAKYQTQSGRQAIGPARLRVADEKIRELELYEEQIRKTFVPLLRNIHRSLTSVENKLANQSHAYLDVSRWQVQKSIRNVKHFMQQMTRGFHVGHKIERSISKLEEGADLVINLYDQIEMYQDQKRMGDFISSINKAQATGGLFSNPALQAALTDLQVVITSNNIITQCSRALNAFKQQIFPFGNTYLDVIHDDLALDIDGNISDLVSQSEEKLQTLISAVSELKSGVQSDRDTNVITKVFSSNYLTSQPFFTWGNDIYNEEITNLLSGEEIVLKAELTIGPNSENAVKFSFINLNIKAINKSVQSELDEAVKFFDVQLKHFGNSHYRCGDQFYVISGESQTFTYSYENYNSTLMTPIRSNQVYKKVKAGDISLSPYAMWAMKLESRTRRFDTLARFKGRVNLELGGEGQVVKANAAVCQGSLDRYYNVYQD